jgi:hypothetical protein
MSKDGSFLSFFGTEWQQVEMMMARREAGQGGII